MAKDKFLNIRIDSELLEKTKTKAERENRTLSNYVENILRKETDNMQDKKYLVTVDYFVSSNYTDNLYLCKDGSTQSGLSDGCIWDFKEDNKYLKELAGKYAKYIFVTDFETGEVLEKIEGNFFKEGK